MSERPPSSPSHQYPTSFDETSHQSTRYLVVIGLTVLGLALASIGLSIFADPYRLFGTPDIDGINLLKPRIYERSVMAKVYAIDRLHPRGVLLGNSRVEIGLDPSTPEWPAQARPAFNGALSGTGMFWASRMFQESVAVSPPSLILVGLDFADFLHDHSGRSDRPDEPDDDERRLLVDRNGKINPARPAQRRRDLIAGTLSIDAVMDSLLTVFNVDRAHSVTMTTDGFNPMRDYSIYVQRIGEFGLFKRKDASYELQFRSYMPSNFTESSAQSPLESLRTILELARSRHIRVIGFIHPYHARYFDIIDRVGLGPTFEVWKRQLCAEAENARRRGGDVIFYDFTGYDAISTEAVPAEGDTSTLMHWYWEPGHYKAALGERMLARMLGQSGDWGQVLTPATLDEDLERFRRERDRYHNTASVSR